MRTLRRLLVLALFVAALVAGWSFAHQNGQLVELDYLLGVLPGIALWQAVGLAFGAGFLVAGALGLAAGMRLKLVERRWRRVAAGLESEIHQLRNLPLATADEAAPRGAPSRLPAATQGEAV